MRGGKTTPGQGDGPGIEGARFRDSTSLCLEHVQIVNPGRHAIAIEFHPFLHPTRTGSSKCTAQQIPQHPKLSAILPELRELLGEPSAELAGESSTTDENRLGPC